MKSRWLLLLVLVASVGLLALVVRGEAKTAVALSPSRGLLPAAGPPSISFVTPAEMYNYQPVALTITGAGFLTPTVSLNAVSLAEMTVIDSTMLTATAPANLPGGVYTVTLDNPDGQKARLTTALWVEDIVPIAESLTINGGALSSTSTAVRLTVSASDPGSGPVTEMRFSNDGQVWSDWRSYATNADWTLAAGDATKTVYGQFRDETGNESAVISDTINLDTTADTEYGLTIDNGALFTNKVAVTLTIGAQPGTAQMQVSNDGGFAGVQWEPYTSRKPWEITRYGRYVIPRVVYLRYRGVEGNTSATYQDDIILDMTPPTGSVDAVAKTSSSNSRFIGTESIVFATDDYTYTVRLPLVMRAEAGPANIVLYLSAQDDLSGVADMMISNQASLGSAVWETYVTPRDWYVPQGATTAVYVKFRDHAGNMSAVTTDIVTTYRTWHEHDLGEPNDTPADAYGSLRLGQTYQAYIWDETDLSDYYHFALTTDTETTVNLTNIPAGCDYDLYVYYWDEGLRLYGHSNQTGSSGERVVFRPVPERKHFIRVYPCRGHSNQQPYHLVVIVG